MINTRRDTVRTHRCQFGLVIFADVKRTFALLSDFILVSRISASFKSHHATLITRLDKRLIGKKVEVSLRLFDIFERNMVFVFLWGS